MRNLIILLCLISTLCAKAQVRYYSKFDLEKDLNFFKEKITNIHPIFLKSAFFNNWQKEFNNAEMALRDSMTLNEFYLTIAPLAALLYDAHSNVLCPTEPRRIFMLEQGGLAFPFVVKIFNKSVFVNEYHGNDSTLFMGGEEILRINSIPVASILQRMGKLVGSEVVSMQEKTIEMNFKLYLWMLYKFEKDYELVTKNNSGDTSTVFVNGITNNEFLKNRKRYSHQDQNQYSLEIDSMRSSSLLTIKTFADLDGFCAFSSSAFQKISASETKNLIIDIRGNMGGRSIVVDSLMNYLTSKQYSQYKTIEVRISQELKDYYKTKYPEVYELIKDKPNGVILDFPCEVKTPEYKKTRYNGNLFLLTDRYTYSGASTFAGLFKELKLGVIVGEETGGTIEYYGDFWFQELPITKLQFYVSPKRFVQFGGKRLKRGVLPDYFAPNSGKKNLKKTYELILKKGRN
jgi:hypothetical protein